MQILVVDVGGTHVKILAAGQETVRKLIWGLAENWIKFGIDGRRQGADADQRRRLFRHLRH
jgi:hypothetical protein